MENEKVDEKGLASRVEELEKALQITSGSIARNINRFDYEELDGSGSITTAEEIYNKSLQMAKDALAGAHAEEKE